MDGLFSFDNLDEIFVYDTFNLIQDNKIETKSNNPNIDNIYKTATDLFGALDSNGERRWKKSFTYPSASNQKTLFSCNPKIANDTKVYQTNVGVYVESGIKVKSMKKNGLGIWSKFNNPTTAIMGNLAIMETWDIDFAEVDDGWIDINTVNYDDRPYTVATRKVNEYIFGPPYDSSIPSFCNSAKSWARGKGYNIDKIDAIRFVSDETGPVACVRFLDLVQTEGDGKSSIIFNFKYGGSTFDTGTPIVVGNATVSNLMKNRSREYEVMGFFVVGYSDYNNERNGIQFNYYGGM